MPFLKNPGLCRLLLLPVVLASVALSSPAHAETVFVKTTDDVGPGSLREAITLANEDPGHTNIDFAIPTDFPEVPAIYMIQVHSPLPHFSAPVTIDGSTQPVTDILIRNETPLPLFDFVAGSEGSEVFDLMIRSSAGGTGVLLETDAITLEALDFVYMPHAVQFIDHASPSTPPGGELHDIVIRHSTFIATRLWSEALLYGLDFSENELKNAYFQAGTPFGLETSDCRFQGNTFAGGGAFGAIRLMHASRCKFVGNAFSDYENGIILSSLGGPVGENVIVENKFLSVNQGASIVNKKNTRNTFSRNLFFDGDREPLGLSPLTMSDWGNPDFPNAGKGRPTIDGAFLWGSSPSLSLVLYGSTFETVGVDKMEIFLSDGSYSHLPASDFLSLEVTSYVETASALGTFWYAVLPLSEYSLGSGSVWLTVSATDESGNTSEFAVPYQVQLP